jgi:GMP synthase-like glutamine amidotransferase
MASTIGNQGDPPRPPNLTNNPREDVIATNKRPLLSFFNSTGGIDDRTYTIQIDKVPTFDSSYLIEYTNIPETPYVTSKLVEEGGELDDNTQYYWRARAIDTLGQKSLWAVSRFFLDTSSDDAFLRLIRTSIIRVETSSGYNTSNIIDVGEAAAGTYWEGYANQLAYWVKFDLGGSKEVSRIWQLCDRSRLEGRLKDYIWQYSNNAVNWKDIPETRTRESDAFRDIIKFDVPITGRYFRLYIKGWHGPVPRIHEITLYSPGVPAPPQVPATDYVLIVGNRHHGREDGNIRRAVENSTFNLETVTVPYYQVSLDMVNHLEPKPVAIILSGFDRWYENLPMFEFNGEYELIRESNIPILGICGGHQFIVMAYGYTYARDMGYGVYTCKEENLKGTTPISIIKEDPIFEGIPNPFYAPGSHSWEVVVLPDDVEVLAVSDCIE